jgi:alpha-N-arabinofuranosidase
MSHSKYLIFLTIASLSVAATGRSASQPEVESSGKGNDKNEAVIDLSKAKYKISKDIYGQFSEHLGHCIYGGYWVGESSPIPNIRGLRTDVVEALKRIHVPVLRWPGGCFADEYHWKNGVGPRGSRPSMINTNWGGVTEDNSFGTHEYLDLCQQIGCEPYISGNLGSGTVQELSQWVEYVNSGNVSPMTQLRKKNGRDQPWNVTFWGLGNEAWGCGGHMRPEYYADVAKRYASFMKDFGETRLKLIAVGPGGDDYHWTEVVMREAGSAIWGLSLHHYTWSSDEQATDVTEKSWYSTMAKTLVMEELVTKHSAVMDKYDPARSVALVVDEWGTWYAVEPGTNPAFLFQQNTLRDALVAGINLNIFNNHCSRVRMAAVAQTVNVLQALIFTQGAEMVLTPTYMVYDLYKDHQDAIMIPVSLRTDSISAQGIRIPALQMSSSLDNSGRVHITLCNLNADHDEKVTCNLSSFSAQSANGRVLTADRLSAHNTFVEPRNVGITSFHNFEVSPQAVDITVPRHSIVALELIGTLEIASPAVDLNTLEPGFAYKYYEGRWQRLPEFSELTPLRSGILPNAAIPEGTADHNFGLFLTGFLRVEKADMVDFFLTSDDGSKLTIDGEDLIVNDGQHPMVEKEGSIFLTKGYHAVQISFFQAGGGSGLKLMMKEPGGEKKPIENSEIFHAPQK